MERIRPSIYVGLGGTGIKAISQTKKMFEEVFGEKNIPSQIAFVAIDFDLSEDPNLPTSMHEDFVTINNINNPRQLYQNRIKEGDYQWMFPGNAKYITNLVGYGTNQLRTTGRFYTEMIINSIERRIADCYTQVTNIPGGMGLYGVDIHIAMSLAGGTGSGSFLNIASMLRDKYQDKVKIIGYGILHGIFRTMDPSANKTPRIVANAYSAILDLDYLMSASYDNPIPLTLNGRKTELKQSIFDEFFVIDNEMENGKRVDNISELCEVVGTCMYVAGSEMGSKIMSSRSSIHWRYGGLFNISSKLGWVQGLGACQVVYKGKLLAEIYGYMAAIELIRKMQSCSADIQQKAQNWTEQEYIREDGDEYNMLIDAIYAPEKIAKKVKGIALDVRTSIADVKVAVAKDLDELPNDFPDEKTNAVRSKEINAHLQTTVSDMLKHEAGVGNALAFLHTLRMLCEKYKTEMDDERISKEKEIAALVDKLETKTFKAYQEYREKFFTTKNGKQVHLENIEREVKKIKVLKLESKRRVIAYNTFSSVLATIDALLTRVQAINDTLTALKNSYSLELTSKQNPSENNLMFEYDLSYKERVNMAFNPDDVWVTVFTKTCSLYDIKLDDLSDAILNYVSGLYQAEQYRNKLIVDVLDELSDDDYIRLKKEINEKSSRLLKLNDRGQLSKTHGNKMPTSMLVQNYMISIYNRVGPDGEILKSRLEADNEFLRNNNIKKEYIHSGSDSMKQKIIFYREDMSIIPYCIDAFDDVTVESEYGVFLRDAMQSGSMGFNPHFDRQIFEDMRKKDFKLKPEMQNEALFCWVCGNLFGWREITEDMHIMEKDSDGEPVRCVGKEEVIHPKYICVKNGKYMYWDEIDQEWMPIDNTARRDHAYSYFKTAMFPELKTVLTKKIKDEIDSRGKEYYISMIQNMIDNGIHDYINCIVCSNEDSLTISSQNDGAWNQYLEEWSFIEKDLINSLDNIKS